MIVDPIYVHILHACIEYVRMYKLLAFVRLAISITVSRKKVT